MSKHTLPPFAAIRAFVAVGQYGGIRRAAEALGISHAIVSRHLSSLEQRFGQLLLDRSSGRLTDAGNRYHAKLLGAVSDMEAASDELSARREKGLSIWCSAGFALHWLAKRLNDFTSSGTRPVVDLRSTDNEPALERGEADGDIRYLHDSIPAPVARGLRMLELARPTIFPVASPDFLQRLQNPIRQPADFLRQPLIEETDGREWASWFAAQNVGIAGRRPPVSRYGQAHLTLAAARSGQGIALSNAFLARDDIEAGRLRVVGKPGETFHPHALGAYVFRASRARWSDKTLAKFRDWLSSAIASDQAGSA